MPAFGCGFWLVSGSEVAQASDIVARSSDSTSSLESGIPAAAGQATRGRRVMRLLRSFVVLLLLIVSSALGITSASAHGSCEASASFENIGVFEFRIQARVDCTEAHAKLKIRSYVQWRSLADPSWNNLTGETAINVKYQTKFISDQRGFYDCGIPVNGFSYRVVIDFFNVWNASGKHITQHEIFDGWNNNEFELGCAP